MIKDIMEGYPFSFLDSNGEIEYLTEEYIHYNFSAKEFKEMLEKFTKEQLIEFTRIQETWQFKARKKQRPPVTDEDYIIAICGRGWGKTMYGANWLIHKIKNEGVKYSAIAGATEKDLFQTMISGDSGILMNCTEDFMPILNKTERTLTWPNGSVTYCYSSESPEGPRGGNLGCVWIDEIVKFKQLEEFWSNLEFGMRKGDSPQTLFTSTPKRANVACSRFMKRIIGYGAYVINGSSRENYKISKKVLARWEKNYGGTQKGKEELEGILDFDESEGAVFFQKIIDSNRLDELPEGVYLKSKILAIDPSNSNNDNSDECGLIVAGLGSDEKAYILEDYSGKMSVGEWANKAIEIYHSHKCDLIVAESNNGGDLVEDAITVRDSSVNVKQVKALVSKKERAGPVGGLYEQGRVIHLGSFTILEDQMVCFDPNVNTKSSSPDRMDALVWAVTELIVMADPDAQEWIDAYRTIYKKAVEDLPKSRKNDYNNIQNNFDELLSIMKEQSGIDFESFSIFNEKI